MEQPDLSKLLSDRVAVVTGAGRGIGSSVATTLARSGAKVVLASRSVGADVAASINEAGGSAVFVQANVADVGAPDRIIDAAIKSFGRVDILVNNAVVPALEHSAPVQDISPGAWRKQFSVNLDACLQLAQRGAIEMLRQGEGGRIVNISSIVAYLGVPGAAAYQTSKRALIGLTEALAIELAPSGINVNAVVPGFIRTRYDDPDDSEWRRRFLATGRLAARRMGDPRDIANVVLFLASPMASYVVGQAIIVDGGLSITLG
jgi:NAD(P)-dependent dehydrogenase (short-subunit alcohol dehydrogenase family)